MKKITVVLLTSTACLLSACYSSPEFKTNAQRQAEGELAITCGSQEELYQHAALKSCVESKMKMADENKKTVYISQDRDGNPLVVPKDCGVEQMLERNRVYPVVDIRDNVVEEEGKAPDEVLNPKVEEVEEEEITPAEEEVEAPEEAEVETEAKEEVEEEKVEEKKEVKEEKEVLPAEKDEEPEEKATTEETVEETKNNDGIATQVDMKDFLKEDRPIPATLTKPETVDEVEATMSVEDADEASEEENEKEFLPSEEK